MCSLERCVHYLPHTSLAAGSTLWSRVCLEDAALPSAAPRCASASFTDVRHVRSMGMTIVAPPVLLPPTDDPTSSFVGLENKRDREQSGLEWVSSPTVTAVQRLWQLMESCWSSVMRANTTLVSMTVCRSIWAHALLSMPLYSLSELNSCVCG